MNALKYILKKLATLFISFVGLTAAIFASILLFSPESRASLYLSPRPNRSPETTQRLITQYIEEYRLDDPFLTQYGRWFVNLFQGEWGYSPNYDADIFDVVLRYTPATLELLLFSLLLFIPVGILTGVLAGRRRDRPVDLAIRLAAFTASSIPLFILAFIFLAVFYIALGWFAPGRLSVLNTFYVKTPSFQFFTGFMTLDGLLNGRPDISLDALRHLALPALTLSLLHWAAMTRLTRAVVIEEEKKEYVTAAYARGLPGGWVTWRHIFLNCLSPVLTASALTAATLMTELFVVEIIYNYEGLTQLIRTLLNIPDGSAVMGFIVINILLTFSLIFVFDVAKAFIDPRIREEVI
jgi:peptide/nickel transport system permease protein